MGLLIRTDGKSVFLSKQIGDAVNRRFHNYSKGVQQGVATPHTDALIELQPHPRYKYNVSRYMRVVRSIAVKESIDEQQGRLRLLEKQLLDPVTSSTAALRLEAIGKDGIPTLHNGLNNNDPEVRFYSSEALAYLDDATAATALGEAVRSQPGVPRQCLDGPECAERRRIGRRTAHTIRPTQRRNSLWGLPSPVGNEPTRSVNSGRSISTADSTTMPLRTGGPPMVHVTRSFRPEIVTFGPDQVLRLPLSVDAGKSIGVNSTNGNDGPADGKHITVSRFEAGKPDQKRVVSCRLDDVIHAIVDLNGTYPDVVQFLQRAKTCGALAMPARGRCVAESVPQFTNESKAKGRSRRATVSRWPRRYRIFSLRPDCRRTFRRLVCSRSQI